MSVVLMIAEKPSLAESLAKILSNGRSTKRKGINATCLVHEYKGTFMGHQNVLFKFTSVCGHVMSIDFTGKFNDWDRVEPQELFKAPIIKKEANPGLNIVKHLQNEAKRAKYLVLWLDCDKEGENICFEVIDSVQPVMNISFENPQTVFRARFSAITEKDVKAAMQSLTLPNRLESLSVDARQESDLRIGCAFTRFQTKFFHNKYVNLDSHLISFGPCQTPTLGFCVERHDKIQAFQPEKYCLLSVNVISPSGMEISLEWERERQFNINAAKKYLSKVKSAKTAKVISIIKINKAKIRPQALNTVELLRVASSGLGLSPHNAMSIAERLYTQGYISYPRTETTAYGANFDLKATLKIQRSHNEWGAFVEELLSKGITKPRPGFDAGDHPPITPMRRATSEELSGDNWRLYQYIVKHFIGTLSGDMKYEQTTVKLSIGDEKFFKTGNTVLDLGYTEIMDWHRLKNDQRMPINIKVGDEMTISDAKLDERFTTPPDYLTEADLISLMEKHGIGTDASIPTHINNICQRNYVKVSSGRKLVPTKLGIVLVHGYQRIDNDLVLPTTRANIEKILNLISTGQEEYESVLMNTLQQFNQKFDNFIENISLMDELFEVSFSSVADSGKAISRCGKCRRYLKLISAKPVRLYCQHCNETLSLPQNGSFRTFKERRCPIDDYEVLYYTGSGENGKSYILCPNCYNNPPFENMSKRSGCHACTNYECEMSMKFVELKNCDRCKYRGTIVLDIGSGDGRKWIISCNKCDYSFSCFKGALKVKIEEEKCYCKSKLLSIEYKDREPRLVKGCLFCSPQLQDLVESKASSSSTRGRLRNDLQKDRMVKGNLRVTKRQTDFASHSHYRGRGVKRGGRIRARGRGRGTCNDSVNEDYIHRVMTLKLSDFL